MRTVTDDDIYRYYLGDIIVGNVYLSPLPDRGKRDIMPSFQLYEKNGRLLWIDYGMSNQFGNKPENLVQHLKGLPLTHKGYYDAKRIIESEVRIGVIGKPLVQLKKKPPREVVPYAATTTYRDFELEYWNRFNINEDDLLAEDIHPLQSLSWAGEGGKPHVVSKPSDPAFIYWWNQNPASWKLYRPMQGRDKFRQENVRGVIEGWNSLKRELPDGKLKVLFITSSTKDRLVVKKAFLRTDVNAINPRGERDRDDIVARKDEIRAMADRVIILYDADAAGYDCSKTLAELTGFEYFDLRGKLDGQKDLSDYVDTERGNHSYAELRKLIKTICK